MDINGSRIMLVHSKEVYNVLYYNKKLSGKHRITYLSQHVGVEVFEDFIETKFTQSLHGIPNECWCPSQTKSSHSTLGYCNSKATENTSIFLWIDLNSTFNQIERNDGCVCDTATEDSTKSTKGKKLGWSILTAIFWKNELQRIVKLAISIKKECHVTYFSRNITLSLKNRCLLFPTQMSEIVNTKVKEIRFALFFCV